MDTLDKLLGGSARVRLLRLFLLNPEVIFSASDIAKKSKVRGSSLRTELNALKVIKLIKKSPKGYKLSRSFEFLVPLRSLLLNTEPFKDDEIVYRFRHAGRLKLVLVSGLFTQDQGSRVDILVVGDRLNRPRVERALRDMESEVGKELSYAVFETPEFKYRMEVYDKFIRDILDYPHKVLLDKIGI